MKINTPLDALLSEIFKQKDLLYAVLSSPRANCPVQKINVRPIEIKEQLHFQISNFQGPQVFHENISEAECLKILMDQLQSNFKQGLICTSEADYQVLIDKKHQPTILKKPPSKSQVSLTHNRPKQYIMEPGTPISFLVELGIMTKDGKVVAKKSDKFKQLNRFLEMIADVLPALDKGRKLHIIDFGCGKAYLTFALYHYLVDVNKWEVDIQGLDLKKDVILHCQELADKMGYSGLHFTVGDINQFKPDSNVDMVITLHACDTATDAALEKAIRWQAEVILSVPCCQHELYDQVKSDALAPILHHGILKERFASLATDAARVQLLEILGYQTQILEFIDLEHTPKNLLIRAVKRKSKKGTKKSLEEYNAFKKALNINPSLERRFQMELKNDRIP